MTWNIIDDYLYALRAESGLVRLHLLAAGVVLQPVRRLLLFQHRASLHCFAFALVLYVTVLHNVSNVT